MNLRRVSAAVRHTSGIRDSWLPVPSIHSAAHREKHWQTVSAPRLAIPSRNSLNFCFQDEGRLITILKFIFSLRGFFGELGLANPGKLLAYRSVNLGTCELPRHL